jgi:protein O-GlcNAc transferase
MTRNYNFNKYILFLLIIIWLFLNLFSKFKHRKETFENRKKIISFSLWGNNECYNWGAVENVLLAKKIYPGWICRFYVGKDIIPEVRDKLKNLPQVEVIEMDEDREMGNMFWRFKPMFEEDCEAVLSRDTDSRLNIKEKKCVDKWLHQDKDLLLLRDHKNHNQPVMGGMFGVKNNCFHSQKKLFHQTLKEKTKGKFFDDQLFLRKIHKNLKDNCLIFDSHHHFKNEKIEPYPKNNFQGYIGQIVCNDFKLTNQKYGMNLKKTSIKKPYPIPEDSAI